MGREGPRKLKRDGAEDDGAETGSRQPHLRSQSGPELPADQPPQIAQGVSEGATRVRLDPGNGNVVMSTDLLKKAT